MKAPGVTRQDCLNRAAAHGRDKSAAALAKYTELKTTWIAL
jgi:hypothetical protein